METWTRDEYGFVISTEEAHNRATGYGFNTVCDIGSSIGDIAKGVCTLGAQSRQIEDLKRQIKKQNEKDQAEIAELKSRLKELQIEGKALDLRKYWKDNATYSYNLFWAIERCIFEEENGREMTDKEWINRLSEFPNDIAKNTRKYWFKKTNGKDKNKDFEGNINDFIASDDARFLHVEEDMKPYNWEPRRYFLLCLNSEEIVLLGPNVINHLSPISLSFARTEQLASFTAEQVRYFNYNQLQALANLPKGYLPRECPLYCCLKEFLRVHPEFRPSVNDKIEEAKKKSHHKHHHGHEEEMQQVEGSCCLVI